MPAKWRAPNGLWRISALNAADHEALNELLLDEGVDAEDGDDSHDSNIGNGHEDYNFLRRVNNSYWIHMLKAFYTIDITYGDSTKKTNSVFKLFNLFGIWWRFSRMDWKQIVFEASGGFLNRIALYVDEMFWDALHRRWPTWINDAERSNHIFTAWSHLLFYYPEYALACKNKHGWRSFDKGDWQHLLLKKGSRFLDNVDRKMLDADFWVPLLTEIPELGETCDTFNGWKKFTVDNWYLLLTKQPRFTGKCNLWQHFSGKQWANLLILVPDISAICDESDGWSKLGKEDWLTLLEKEELDSLFGGTAFTEKCRESGAMAKFGWQCKEEALAEAHRFRRQRYRQTADDTIDEPTPDWREESGWNEMYGDADPSDFIEFR